MAFRFALLAAAAAVAGAVIDNPLPSIPEAGAWCQHIITHSLDKKDTTIPAGKAACVKVAKLRCTSWWGTTTPDFIPACEALYLAVLYDTTVMFPSGFSFIASMGGFAAAKKWYLAPITKESMAAITGSTAFAALSAIAQKDAFVLEALTKKTPVVHDVNLWVAKMCKRLQMAVVVDERQIITDAIIKYCKETVTDSTLQMQAAGSIDVTSDYDVTFLGLGAPKAVACGFKAFAVAIGPLAAATGGKSASDFLSSGTIYDVNFMGEDFIPPQTKDEINKGDKTGKFARSIAKMTALFSKKWSLSKGSGSVSSFYEARASFDSLTWLIAHLAFENPDQANFLFRNAIGTHANLDWMKPTSDLAIDPAGLTAYADSDRVDYIFEYTPYDLGVHYMNQFLAKANNKDLPNPAWRPSTMVEYHTRAKDFRRLLFKIHSTGTGIAAALRRAATGVCTKVAEKLAPVISNPPCEDFHSEIMRLTLNIMYVEALKLADALDKAAATGVTTDGGLSSDTVQKLGVALAVRKMSLLVAPEAYSTAGAIYDVVGAQVSGGSGEPPKLPFISYVESMVENAFHVLFKKPSKSADSSTYLPDNTNAVGAFTAFKDLMGNDLKRGGKYLQRWAYALTLIDKDIGGLLTPAPVDLKNGVCLPNILMRSDDGLGKALTRANSGWISNSAVAGKAFLSFEINMQSRFAAQAKLVKKGSLAYEFAARGEELKKASKSPDVDPMGLLEQVGLAIDRKEVMPTLPGMISETTMAVLAEGLSYKLTHLECWTNFPTSGTLTTLIKPECSVSDYPPASDFDNAGDKTCTPKDVSGCTLKNFMGAVADLSVGKLDKHLKANDKDGDWLDTVRGMIGKATKATSVSSGKKTMFRQQHLNP